MSPVRPVLLLVLAAAGCNNPCQRLCVRLADYAAECGLDVSSSELDACLDEQADAPGDDLRACRTGGDPITVREQWTCDDLRLFFD